MLGWEIGLLGGSHLWLTVEEKSIYGRNNAVPADSTDLMARTSPVIVAAATAALSGKVRFLSTEGALSIIMPAIRPNSSHTTCSPL